MQQGELSSFSQFSASVQYSCSRQPHAHLIQFSPVPWSKSSFVLKHYMAHYRVDIITFESALFVAFSNLVNEFKLRLAPFLATYTDDTFHIDLTVLGWKAF